MLETPPSSVSGTPPPARLEIRGIEVLSVPTPSELRYELEPGRYRATGKFGVDPKMLLDGSLQPTDVRILLRAADGREGVLFRKTLDPANEPLDRQLQTFSQTIDSTDPLTLVLQTRPPAGGEPNEEGAFWMHVKVAPRTGDLPE